MGTVFTDWYSDNLGQGQGQGQPDTTPSVEPPPRPTNWESFNLDPYQQPISYDPYRPSTRNYLPPPPPEANPFSGQLRPSNQGYDFTSDIGGIITKPFTDYQAWAAKPENQVSPEAQMLGFQRPPNLPNLVSAYGIQPDYPTTWQSKEPSPIDPLSYPFDVAAKAISAAGTAPFRNEPYPSWAEKNPLLSAGTELAASFILPVPGGAGTKLEKAESMLMQALQDGYSFAKVAPIIISKTKVTAVELARIAERISETGAARTPKYTTAALDAASNRIRMSKNGIAYAEAKGTVRPRTPPPASVKGTGSPAYPDNIAGLPTLPSNTTLTSDLSRKYNAFANLPVIRNIVGVFSQEPLAKGNRIITTKILQGRLYDAVEQFTNIAMSPINEIINKGALKGINIIKEAGTLIVRDPNVTQISPFGKKLESMALHDIIENASHYQMPDGMRTYVDKVREIAASASKMAESELKKYGVDIPKVVGEDNFIYLRRLVKEINKTENKNLLKMTDKLRKYATVEEAVLGEGKPVTYFSPTDELYYHIKTFYNAVANARVKASLEVMTVTPKSRIPGTIIQLRDDAKTKLGLVNRIMGKMGVNGLIDRASRGEELAAATLAAVRGKFPDLADKLETLIARRQMLNPAEVTKLLTRLSSELKTTLALDSTKFNDAIAMARGGIPVTKDAPVALSDIMGALKVLKADNKTTINMLTKVYKNIVESRVVKRPEFQALKESFAATAKQVVKDHVTAQKDYDLAMADAQVRFEEGTCRFLGPGRIFTTQKLAGKLTKGKDIASMVNAQFGFRDIAGGFEKNVKLAGKVGGVLMELKASLDLSLQGVQTLPAFGLDFANLVLAVPRILKGVPAPITATWAKGAVRGWQAAFNPKATAIWLNRADIKAARMELASHMGLGSFGNELTQEVGILERLPVLGKAYERASSAFSVGRSATQIEMWKGMKSFVARDAKNPAEINKVLTEFAQWTNLATGTLSTRAMGIGSEQRAVETVLIFAPKLLRSTFALLGELGSRGLQGKMAREAIFGLLGGATAVMTACAIAMGQKPRVNPLPESLGGDGGKYLTVQIGQMNIGFGGSIFTLMRMLASVADKIGKNQGEDLVKFDMANPMVRFLRAKLGAVDALGVDFITGTGYLGNLTRSNFGDVAKTLGDWAVPMWIDDTLTAWDRSNQPFPTIISGAASVLGFRVLPQTDWDLIQEKRNSYVSKMYPGKQYSDLNKSQIEHLNKAYPDLAADRQKYDQKNMQGDPLAQAITQIEQNVVDKRNKELDALGTAWLDGQITHAKIDSQLAYIKPYASGARNALYELQNTMSPQDKQRMEQWLDAHENPADKATDAYNDYRNTLIERGGVNIDWKTIESNSISWIEQNYPEYKDYILSRKDAWIEQLPPAAQQLMKAREQMMASGAWWKDYNGTAKPQPPLFNTRPAYPETPPPPPSMPKLPPPPPGMTVFQAPAYIPQPAPTPKFRGSKQPTYNKPK